MNDFDLIIWTMMETMTEARMVRMTRLSSPPSPWPCRHRLWLGLSFRQSRQHSTRAEEELEKGGDDIQGDIEREREAMKSK